MGLSDASWFAATVAILLGIYIGERILDIDFSVFLAKNRKKGKIKRMMEQRGDTTRQKSGIRREIRKAFERILISTEDGKIRYENYRKHAYLRILQSRHIRNSDRVQKKKSYYSTVQKIICPSCGASVELTGQQVVCEYCGGVIRSEFYDWQTERFELRNEYKKGAENMFEEMTEQQAREQILEMTKEYCEKYHNQKKPYEKGDRIPYASRVYDADEMVNLVDSSLEFWLTSGRFTKEFESEFAKYLGVKYCSLVNSGSSANLLAFMALTSPLLKERQILPGDEVITVAAGFPTTVAPVIQYGAVPVFVDVAIPQYNIDPNLLEQAVSEKTKAVMLAHTLGNPFDLKAVKDFCDRHNLWLIEDNCDALGSRYTIDGESRLTGTIGDIGTSSFYPPHHMTMGEGGAVYTKNPLLHKIVRSFRDWGRDCVCAPGQDNLCGHRFDRQYGELPLGYDHKYVYSHFGYNLKATDMQAAVGCAQLRKFPSFVERRIHNFNYLKEALKGTEDKLILPEACENSEPSWFGFLITCREGVDRNQLVQKIEEKGVQTRMLFAGNLIKHPCFDQMRATGKGYRVAGSLENTDRIMTDTFWIGVYPGMTDAMLDAMADAIKEALE